jgi:UPF0042 nucleotide-binding protein
MTAAARTAVTRRTAQARFVVLTGLSGAGKSQAIRALEDLGYFCVDNLPTMMIPTMAELAGRAIRPRKVAIVVDVREGRSCPSSRRCSAGPSHAGPAADPDLPRGPRRDAGRRFSETRRPHPLAKDRPVLDGIHEERRALKSIRHGRRSWTLAHGDATARRLHGGGARP